MNKPFRNTFFISATICALTFGSAYAETNTTQTKTKSESHKVLYVISAKSGELKKSDKGYQLTLKNVDSKVLWFQDRPGRKAGHIMIDAVVKNWKQEFKTSQPNAALVHAGMKLGSHGASKAVSFELTNPFIVDKDTVRFDVSFLKGDTKQLPTGDLVNPQIFIDSSGPCWSCGGYP